LKGKTLLLTTIMVIALIGTANAIFPGKQVIWDTEKTKEQGKVVFDGTTHQKAGVKCTDCHVDPFGPPKVGKPKVSMTMDDINAGKFCGKCHNGKTQIGDKTVFSTKDEKNCARCHKK